MKLSQYEVVNFKGWFGLMLAVQQGPIVVNIEASEDSFINYERVIFFLKFNVFWNPNFSQFLGIPPLEPHSPKNAFYVRNS